MQNNKFFKAKKTDKIWWVDTNEIGKWLFSFDKKKIYNMFRDYPDNMTEEEVAIFDRENPYWKKYFAERRE